MRIQRGVERKGRITQKMKYVEGRRGCATFFPFFPFLLHFSFHSSTRFVNLCWLGKWRLMRFNWPLFLRGKSMWVTTKSCSSLFSLSFLLCLCCADMNQQPQPTPCGCQSQEPYVETVDCLSTHLFHHPPPPLSHLAQLFISWQISSGRRNLKQTIPFPSCLVFTVKTTGLKLLIE